MRSAKPLDSSAIARLVIAAGMFPPEAEDFLDGMMTSYFDTEQPNGHSCLVDEQDGQLIGVAYYQPKPATDRVWDLTMLGVHPGAQGRGRGAALLSRVELDLASRDQRLLVIETSAAAQYDLTRQFYAKNGYTDEARIRDYWEDGDDLVIFTKDLRTG